MCNSGFVGVILDDWDIAPSGRETIPGVGDRDSERRRRRSTMRKQEN